MGKTYKNIRKTLIIGTACRERFLPLQHSAAAPLTDLGVNLAGLSDLSGKYRIGREDPGFHLLLYTLAGRGRLERPSGMEFLGPGAVFVAPARRPYAYELAGRSWRILWFHFDAELAPEALFPKEPAVRGTLHLELLRANMEGVLREAHAEEPESGRAARAHAELLAVGLKRELNLDPDSRAREVRRRLRLLWEEVSSGLRLDWSVPELARLFHVSPGHFNRLVTRFHGAKPMQVVARMRMDRAGQLLRNSDYPVKQIAELVGYRNPFAFSVAFKREMGHGPRAYRALRSTNSLGVSPSVLRKWRLK